MGNSQETNRRIIKEKKQKKDYSILSRILRDAEKMPNNKNRNHLK